MPFAGFPARRHHVAVKTRGPVRRRLAAIAGIGVLSLAIAVPTGSAATSVALKPVVTGLRSPVALTDPDDGTSRLFVAEQGGRIRVIKNGALLSKPFLDISRQVSSGGERGLLGIAFHPNYRANGKFYVNFTRASDGATAINEYRVSGSDPDVARKSSHRRIMTLKQPAANHNGGSIAFGPDGYLYIGTGDGGGSGDPGNRAQRLSSLLGKMLRIDINGTTKSKAYRIPRSNPYVGRPGKNQIWSRGLRNPWGWSFDRATTDLWIADVGQERYEEVNRSKASTSSKSRGRGVNYGWRVMEGRHCYLPSSGCDKSGKVKPVVEYSHSQGCSIIGGYVYRGSAVPGLAAKYVFGDFCSGKIWTIPRNASKPAAKTLLLSTGRNITAFGQDRGGELYVLATNGTLYRIEAP